MQLRFSSFSAAVVASIIGFGGTVALVLAAATALDATPSQTASWVTAISLAIALESLFLSWRYKMPIVTAWSAAGLALVGATTGFDIYQGVGAFIITGVMLLITGLFRPISKLVESIPSGLSAGMLAGVMLPFVLQGARAANLSAELVLPLAILFFIIRTWNPSLAVVAVLAAGIGWSFYSGQTTGSFDIELSTVELIMPSFTIPAFFGLALPLYLVTMASQNLPGLAVLRASGYNPPVGEPIALTGLVSILSAPFGASTTNLSAITAAICTGEESHPDPAKRWQVGIWYFACYFLIALFGASLVALIAIMPVALIMLATGLALLAPLTNALMIAMSHDNERIAAMTTFAVTASGISFVGVGAAFWGLVAGLFAYFMFRLRR
ncbi:benzoate/H(+) symporter BenE family transporter [Ahrensia kielensis]|uniref:Benzoate/H(+) symporter BenE family transporter n=1 Tax=Ahrensia kielensis TaxID=76980 RepID=A0ABU9T784_9HYPH